MSKQTVQNGYCPLLKKAEYKTVPQIYAPDGSYIGGYEALS